jgi:hypothetical protein
MRAEGYIYEFLVFPKEGEAVVKETQILRYRKHKVDENRETAIIVMSMWQHGSNFLLLTN